MISVWLISSDLAKVSHDVAELGFECRHLASGLLLDSLQYFAPYCSILPYSHSTINTLFPLPHHLGQCLGDSLYSTNIY